MGFSPIDIRWMRLALREARKGIGRTSPNPAVGAVVVRDGEVVGKGYHRRAGTPHAEVHALTAAGPRAAGGTLYVTLEPCNHTGRTPPCTRAILASGVRRVVVGMTDPNPHVQGGGCSFLQSRGLDVVAGVLAESCEEINRPFIKHATTGRPWVIMKAGMSLDGRIASRPGVKEWITGEGSRREVHRLRNRVDAILVGIGTALCDDPSLTTRLGKGRGRDPLRVILDSGLRLPPRAKVLAQSSTSPTWIFCSSQAAGKRERLEAAGAVVKPIAQAGAGGLDLKALLFELGRAGITSLLVEGGSRVHGSFVRAGLVDEAFLFLAPLLIGAGGIPLIDWERNQQASGGERLRLVRVRRFGDDLLVVGRFDLG